MTDVSSEVLDTSSRPPAGHVVPIVMKTVRIVEILRTNPAGLRVGDLQGRTGYPLSTIYRILRTLTVCNYAFRELGYYRLNKDVLHVADQSQLTAEFDMPH